MSVMYSLHHKISNVLARHHKPTGINLCPQDKRDMEDYIGGPLEDGDILFGLPISLTPDKESSITSEVPSAR